ncbi:DUF6573 family protein [Nocardioides limicola]|uniref:DUF6573 family protein n=1 Tax=Nocardioides limicola TaxID=2803368 RepID=UPI00193B8A7A|nr:DUF6573 family protein [Nocardioides sp. DJM-14]
MSDLTDFFGEPIAVYTMAAAVADGVLIEAGDLAGDLFAWPVLLTAAAWTDCVAWTDEDSERTGAYGQSETGRLWDVLWMTYVAVKGLMRNADRPGQVKVELYRIPNETVELLDGEPQPEKVELKVVVTVDDNGAPVLLISLPEED